MGSWIQLVDTRFPANPAPCCGHILDAAAGFEEDVIPAPGDISICINCGSLLVFMESTTGIMRLATEADVLELDMMDRWQLARAQEFIKRRGRIKDLQ